KALGQVLADELRFAQSRQTRGGENDGLIFAFLELADPRVDVAAQRMDVEIRAECFELRLPAKAAGANLRAFWKGVDTVVVDREKHVVRIYTLGDGDQLEAWRQFGRQVLQTVHREIDSAFGQRFFDLLGEHALSANFGESDIGDLVARGLD